MEAIHGLLKAFSGQILGRKSAEVTSTGEAGEFDATLKSLLSSDPAKKVSEEELFSGLVQERIKKTKGDEALKEFQKVLEESKASHKKADGFIAHEDATKEALKAFQAAGKLTQEETDSIYSQAFAAAQLDDNKEVLFDDRGGPNDPTMAVAAMEQALLLSKALIQKFDAGTEKAPVRSVTEPAVGKGVHGGGGTSEAGSAGFLFKPVSDSDGKLAVLLPSQLAGLVKGVTLVGPNGEIIEKGRYTGNGNGGRDHFRFSKTGGSYPDGLTVQVTMMNDEIVRYIIQETSERNENLSQDSGGGSSGQNTSGSPGRGSTGSGGRNQNTL
jgi:hypothetical protein